MTQFPQLKVLIRDIAGENEGVEYGENYNARVGHGHEGRIRKARANDNTLASHTSRLHYDGLRNTLRARKHIKEVINQ